MTKIWIIAFNTFKDQIRNRILYILFFFAVGILFFSRVMGGLSFNEQERIVLDFGLASSHLCSIVLTIFIGSSLISKELESQTILTILARPISRAEFLIGKYLGFILVISCMLFGLFLVLTLVYLLFGIPLHLSLLIAYFGIWLEILVLLAFTHLFGSISSSFIAVSSVIGLFLIGHSQNSLRFFVEQDPNPLLSFISNFLYYTVPNLEIWNWRDQVVQQNLIAANDFILASLHSFLWVIFYLCIAILVFRRKDCV